MRRQQSDSGGYRTHQKSLKTKQKTINGEKMGFPPVNDVARRSVYYK